MPCMASMRNSTLVKSAAAHSIAVHSCGQCQNRLYCITVVVRNSDEGGARAELMVQMHHSITAKYTEAESDIHVHVRAASAHRKDYSLLSSLNTTYKPQAYVMRHTVTMGLPTPHCTFMMMHAMMEGLQEKRKRKLLCLRRSGKKY